MIKKVLVLGYYDRGNLGDDVFAYVFDKFLKQYTTNPKSSTQLEIQYEIKNIDDVNEISVDTDLILFGGGDLINDYFIHKLKNINTPKICPTYAVGIGIPYPGLIDEGYLDIFDVIIHRNKPDHEKLVNRYGEHRVKHLPDLSYLLTRFPNKKRSRSHSHTSANVRVHKDPKRIGICLAKPIYYPGDPEKYKSIIENFATFFVRIASIKQTRNNKWFPCISSNSEIEDPEYELIFLPFCTGKNKDQNDTQINQDVFEQIKDYGTFDNVLVQDTPIDIDNIIDVFNNFDYTVCTRFHAHVFSAMCNVPMLSVYSSRKVEHLLEELNLTDYGYKMEVDKELLYPIELNNDVLMSKFQHLVNNRQNIIHDLTSYNLINQERIENLMVTLQNLVYYPIHYYLPFEIHKIGTEKSHEILHCILKYFDVTIDSDLNGIDREGFIGEVMERANIYPTDENKSTIGQIMSFVLTRNKITYYNFGISENIFSPKYNLVESCKWIIEDYQQKHSSELQYNNLTNRVPFENRKLNMNFMVQHGLKGYHRSGWSYVLKNFQRLHSNNEQAPIFDAYLDKTFGWDYDFLTRIGFLPYMRNWVGVLHHTPNEEYSEHNLVEVFQKPLFQESLKYCKMLIVFSDYLKEWVVRQLKDNEHVTKIPNIVMLYHPTQLIDGCLHFSKHKYLHNRDKKVIHIGAWLRNTYKIYELNVPKRYRKCALKGKAMDNYFIKDELIDCICDNIVNCVNQEKTCEEYCVGIISRDTKKVNKYVVGLIDMIRRNHESVEIIERVTNETYDKLLSQNVVFINLMDASAVNTVLECIVRSTPILINRVPAVEEYLGKDYPLYYESLEEATKLLQNDIGILSAHNYLKSMDKTKFSIIECVKMLISSEAYITI